MMACVDIMLRT